MVRVIPRVWRVGCWNVHWSELPEHGKSSGRVNYLAIVQSQLAGRLTILVFRGKTYQRLLQLLSFWSQPVNVLFLMLKRRQLYIELLAYGQLNRLLAHRTLVQSMGVAEYRSEWTCSSGNGPRLGCKRYDFLLETLCSLLAAISTLQSHSAV